MRSGEVFLVASVLVAVLMVGCPVGGNGNGEGRGEGAGEGETEGFGEGTPEGQGEAVAEGEGEGTTLVEAPGAQIVYRGIVYEDELAVPENALLGIVKDGEAYLYHPGMGEAELSEENSHRAMGYWIAGQMVNEALKAIGETNTAGTGATAAARRRTRLAPHRARTASSGAVAGGPTSSTAVRRIATATRISHTPTKGSASPRISACSCWPCWARGWVRRGEGGGGRRNSRGC